MRTHANAQLRIVSELVTRKFPAIIVLLTSHKSQHVFTFFDAEVEKR